MSYYKLNVSEQQTRKIAVPLLRVQGTLLGGHESCRRLILSVLFQHNIFSRAGTRTHPIQTLLRHIAIMGSYKLMSRVSLSFSLNTSLLIQKEVSTNLEVSFLYQDISLTFPTLAIELNKFLPLNMADIIVIPYATLEGLQ